MHHEKTERLFQDFPDLFHRDELIHGFECQDGWFELVHRLAERITKYRSQYTEQEDFEVVQVKQKTGELRVYFRGGNVAIRNLIQEAEEESRSICELDGEPSAGLFVCAPHWFRCLCTRCAELHGYMAIEDYLREEPIATPIHMNGCNNRHKRQPLGGTRKCYLNPKQIILMPVRTIWSQGTPSRGDRANGSVNCLKCSLVNS